MIVQFNHRERFASFIKSYVPKFIQFDEIVCGVKLKIIIFIDLQQPLSFQSGQIQKNCNKKSDSFDFKSIRLKYKHKSKTHPVY